MRSAVCWAAMAFLWAMPVGAQIPGTDVRAGVTAWQAGDPGKAVAIWRPLAAAGDADAQFNLAQAYRLGKGVAADPTASLDLYGKAARQGHEQAIANYGLMLFEQGDRKGAMQWIERAADLGDPRALYVYGTALFNGDLVTANRSRAYAYMNRAATANLPPAIDSLAQMDRYLTAEERRRGIEIAADQTRRATTRVPGPPPAPIRTASIAPSRAATPVAMTEPAQELPKPAPAPKKAPLPATPPKPAFVANTTASPAPSGNWRIQLGAFSSATAAEDQWAAFAKKLPGARHYAVRAGKIVRLQAGPYLTRASAAKACTAIGPACFPVKS